MPLYQFLLVIPREPTPDEVDAVFSRSDDVSVETDPWIGLPWVAFDREAPTLVDAIVSGIRELDRCGLPPLQVKADDDLVSIGMIAQRVQRSATTVRGWVRGEVGPGQFPPPVDPDELRRPCFRWSDVACWLTEHVRSDPPAAVDRTIDAVNLALRLRSLSSSVERMGAIRGLLMTGEPNG